MSDMTRDIINLIHVIACSLYQPQLAEMMSVWDLAQRCVLKDEFVRYYFCMEYSEGE